VHFVNVSAKDAAENIAWNNSTSYTATTPDTEKPVISSVELNNSTPNTDDSIIVTVDTTDNVEVISVEASGSPLTHLSGDIWEGTLTALEGVHSVNVSAKDAAGNIAWNNSTSYTATTPIPPQSIREIQPSPGSTWINWTWTNPNDPKFNHTEIYLNDIFQANTSAEYFNATDLQPETNYIIGTRTADTYGNVNETWVNASVKTKPLPDIEQPVIDVNQPEIQLVTLFPANTTAGSKIDISANIKDNAGVTKVMAGDAQLISIGGSWQGNITAPSSPGKYSLSIKANDAAGNTVDTSIPYNVVRRQGGVKVEVLPKVSKVVAGKSTTVIVKVKNTQNIDDTFKVRVNVNGLPAFYRADTSWFNWAEKTVNLRAKQEILIPIEVKVPSGTVTILKVFRTNVNSEKFSVHGSDNGYLVIPR
ncbi:MAG TPA: hypothetical protein VN414_09750, partial [Methanosarcina sp.]|nr:hypothetical protein [Methanosarcina sp.]